MAKLQPITPSKAPTGPLSFPCPTGCGGTITEKKGRYGNFYGCSNYRNLNCKFTATPDQAKKFAEKADTKKKPFTPTEEQSNFFKLLPLAGKQNILIEACAGSGKTKTIEETDPYIPQDATIINLVFNTKNREEAEIRMNSRYTVLTTHQFGLRAYRAFAKGKLQIKASKLYDLGKGMIQNWEDQGWMLSPARKIIDLLKGRLEEPTMPNVQNIINTYHGTINLDSDANIPQLVSFIKRLYDASIAQNNILDFTDMLFFPIYFNVPIPQYDYVLCDEVQDFNGCQIELVTRAIRYKSVFVGDRNQSIYGFRGAMLDSMDQIKASLNCQELPLSMCWRVPKAGGELVNQMFPYINFNVPETAKEGEILYPDSPKEAIKQLTNGDMVLCRLNAPLVKPCFQMLREGRKAYIVGRDIGRNLIELVEKLHSPYLEEFVERLGNWAARETQLLIASGKELQAANVQDKADTILAIASGCRSCDDIIQKIKDIFKDDSAGVAFSTVHKAKGLEAENVLILSNSKMPHPMAKTDWEKQQERNMQYVAYTRFKNKMYITA